MNSLGISCDSLDHIWCTSAANAAESTPLLPIVLCMLIAFFHRVSVAGGDKHKQHHS